MPKAGGVSKSGQLGAYKSPTLDDAVAQKPSAKPLEVISPKNGELFAKQFGAKLDVPHDAKIQGPRPPVAKGWLESMVSKATGGSNEPIDGVQLPSALKARLDADEKSWKKHGGAPGPLFVNGDLARMRFENKKDPKGPETLAWLAKGGAYTIEAHRLDELIGRTVTITPMAHKGGDIFSGDGFTGALEKAVERHGFVKFTLRGEDGESFEVPFLNKYEATSYVGVLHGHGLREVNADAYRPDSSYLGLTVYARAMRGADDPKQRSVDAPAIGTVVAQDASSVTVRTQAGELLKYDVPKDGFLQLVKVPSTALEARGSANWMDTFGELSELVGQRVQLHFDPISHKSSVEAQITAIEKEPSGVLVKYAIEGGLEAQSSFADPSHVIAIPSTTPARIHAGEDAPSFLGQLVDAKLVNEQVHSSGYGAHWWTDRDTLEDVRGVVVAQSKDQITIQAASGETRTLDLGALTKEDRLKGTFHDLSAKPFLLISPLGEWAVREA